MSDSHCSHTDCYCTMTEYHQLIKTESTVIREKKISKWQNSSSEENVYNEDVQCTFLYSKFVLSLV